MSTTLAHSTLRDLVDAAAVLTGDPGAVVVLAAHPTRACAVRADVHRHGLAGRITVRATDSVRPDRAYVVEPLPDGRPTTLEV